MLMSSRKPVNINITKSLLRFDRDSSPALLTANYHDNSTLSYYYIVLSYCYIDDNALAITFLICPISFLFFSKANFSGKTT